MDLNKDLTKIIRTQVNIKPTEFDSYVIDRETTVTFTLKEVKALLAFAEALSLPLQLQFEISGKPIVFIVHNGSTFEANFVLATSKSDVNTQVSSTQNSSSIDRKRKEIHNKSHSPVKKKPHLDTDLSKCLDEDPLMFNDIDLPMEKVINKLDEFIHNKTSESQSILQDNIDCDNIPPSPTSKMNFKATFNRCFESTFDPRIIKGLLVDNSDSE